jgi:hypothetical protein
MDPVPNNMKELRQFLGSVNYYRDFIADYIKVAVPLHRLLTEVNGFHCDFNCQNSFDARADEQASESDYL